MAARRRRYDPDDWRYGPRPSRWSYRQRRGGSCLRDACLLESGCCIAESLDGNCLILGLFAAPQFVTAVTGGGPLLSPATSRRLRPAEHLVALIQVYQRDISARRSACCRFSPTCSDYAVRALRTHGAAKGSWLALRRLIRCRPGGRRGMDPVPGMIP
jgi:uncharacterized protein